MAGFCLFLWWIQFWFIYVPPYCLPIVIAPIYISTNSDQGFRILYTFQHLSFFLNLIVAILTGEAKILLWFLFALP